MITVGMFRAASDQSDSDYARDLILAGRLAGKDINGMRALSIRESNRLRADAAAQILPIRSRVTRTGAETWDLLDCACCMTCGLICQCGEADCACDGAPVIAHLRMPNAGEVMDAHSGRRLDPYVLISRVATIVQNPPPDFDLLDYRVFAALDLAVFWMADSPLAMWAEYPSPETSS